MTATVIHAHMLVERRRAKALPRETIARFLDRVGWVFRLPTTCVLNGHYVLRRNWRRIRIRATDQLVFLSRPRKGNTAAIIGMVALIGLAIFAPAIGGAIAGGIGLAGASLFGVSAGTLIGAGLMVGASLLVSALTAPPAPGGMNAADSSATQFAQYASVTGNVARPGQPIPYQYGRLKTYWDLASNTWSEFVGDDQYVNALLCKGGKYACEAVYLDDTIFWDSVNGIAAAFAGSEIAFYEPGAPVTLFPANVVPAAEAGGQQLPDGTGGGGYVGGFIINNAGTQANAIAVDAVFAQGCYRINAESGNLISASATVIAEARTVNNAGAPTSGYVQLYERTYTFATRSPQRISEKVTVAPGRYEVRLRRTDAAIGGANGVNDIVLQSIRAYIVGPSTFPFVSTIAVRLKASQLTQAAVRRIGVLATRKLLVWNGSAFVEQATRSPAWAFHDAATNGEHGASWPPSRTDFQAIVDFAAGCATRGDTFDHEFRAAVDAGAAFDTILRVARARHRWLGGELSLVRDELRAVPQMVITDRETIAGSVEIVGELNTADQADAVVLQYVDEDTWKPAEVQYPPNSGEFVAQRPFPLTIDGIVNRDRGFKAAAFHYRDSFYRRLRVVLQTEHDGRLLAYGAAVQVQTELAWGASGAVLARAGAALTLDPAPPWQLTGQHLIAIRDKRGRYLGPIGCSQGDEPNLAVLGTLSLAQAEAAAGFSLDEALDRRAGGEPASFDFGVGDKRSRLCVLKQARAADDHRMELTLVVEDERVHAVDDLGDTPDRPVEPILRDNAAPVIDYLDAKFRQGVMEPILDATWTQAAGATSYIADVSYDGGASWPFHWEGTTPGFSQVVDRAALRLRVQAIGARRGAYYVVDLEPPTIILADNVVGLSSLNRDLDARIRQIEQLAGRFADVFADLDVLSGAVNGAVSKIIEGQGQILLGVGSASAEAKAQAAIALQAATDIDTAFAQFLATVFATGPGGSAEGRMRFIAASTASGAAASIGLEVNASSPGTPVWRPAGLYLDAMPGFTRVRVSADQFLIESSGVNSGEPFALFSPSGAEILLNALVKVQALAANSVTAVNLVADTATYNRAYPHSSTFAHNLSGGAPTVQQTTVNSQVFPLARGVMVQITASVQITMIGVNNPDATPGCYILAYLLFDGAVVDTIGFTGFQGGGVNFTLAADKVKVLGNQSVGNHTAAILIETRQPTTVGLPSRTVTVTKADLIFFEPRN
jgi:hypothetical protein